MMKNDSTASIEGMPPELDRHGAFPLPSLTTGRAAHGPSGLLSHKVVLIVDDDPGQRKTLYQLLKARGYQPVVASSAQAALASMREERPDVALIDLRLDHRSGLDLIRQLKAIAPDVECILLTGYASQESAIEAINLGVFGYLRKPYDPTELLLAIHRAMERRHHVQTLHQERSLLRTLLDTLPDFIFVKDRQSRFIITNAAHLQVLGAASLEQVIGKTDFDFFPRELAERYYKDEQSVMASGQPLLNRLEEVVDPQGRRSWLLTSKVPLRDEQGAVIGLVEVSRDVSERKQAEEEVRRQAAHFEALNAIIHAAARAATLKEFLQIALDETLRALDLDMGALWARGRRALRKLPASLGAEMVALAQAEGLDISGPDPVEDWQAAPGSHSPALAEIIMRYGIRASIIVPVRANGERIGGLVVAAAQPRRWRPDEIALMEAVGRELGLAAERQRLLDETRAHDERMSRLAAVSQTLTHPLDAAGLHAVIGRGAQQLCRAGPTAVFTLQEDGNLETSWSHGFAAEQLEQLAAHVAARLREQEPAQQAQPLLIADVTELPADSPWRLVTEAVGCRSLAVWPLSYKGRLLAVVTCHCRDPRVWAAAEIETMQAFASEAAIAMENARLYASLQATNQELRAALQAREEMIQNVSHELRTPLTIILGYSEMLSAGLSGPLDGEQLDAINTIHQQGRYLLKLLDRILTLQEIDRSGISRQPLDLAIWLRALVEHWQQPAEQAGIQLSLQLPQRLPKVQADPDLLMQALEALLENAIKFSPDGGSVQVSVAVEERQVHIAVADQGIGLAPQHLEQIFEPFFQVDGSLTRRFGGMGLGLTLCRKIVDAHGGRLWAESPGLGRGSTLHLVLPLTEQ